MHELREFSKVSKTAFPHIYFRSFYGIPHAEEMSQIAGAKEKTEEVYGREGFYEDIIPIMEARYKSGEMALEGLIHKNPNAQVVELAAGFSLHGTILAEKYPGIEYFETDYSPEIINIKKDIVENTLLKQKLSNLHFAEGNALDSRSLDAVLASADLHRPLLIYNEGLMSYFTEKEKEQLAENIKDLLHRFGGAWITPDPALSAERRNRLSKFTKSFMGGGVAQRAEKMAGQKYDDHGFQGEQEADEFFVSRGFEVEKIPQPTNLVSFEKCGFDSEMIRKLSDDIQKHGKVWILKMRS